MKRVYGSFSANVLQKTMDYRTPPERLWDNLKIEASKWAVSDKPLPEPAACEDVIRRMAGGLRMPDDIVAFYAAEFSAIVIEKRERLGDPIT